MPHWAWFNEPPNDLIMQLYTSIGVTKKLRAVIHRETADGKYCLSTNLCWIDPRCGVAMHGTVRNSEVIDQAAAEVTSDPIYWQSRTWLQWEQSLTLASALSTCKTAINAPINPAPFFSMIRYDSKFTCYVLDNDPDYDTSQRMWLLAWLSLC